MLWRDTTTLTCGCAAYTVSDMPTLTTPDAIHVATAIYFGCEKLHTFDQNDQRISTK